MNRIAIIVGNGKSRKEIDLNQLVGQGEIYGCNALYRDFNGWDYLVAIDDRMIAEITKAAESPDSNISGDIIFPPEEERYEVTTGRRSNSGMNAMLEAIRRNNNVLYCIGFDFILNGEDSVDNIYLDTEGYEAHTQQGLQQANYNRVKYLEWFATQFPEVKFIFVIPQGSQTKVINAPNVYGQFMNTFLDKIKN
jgi:hypothetical protein